MRKISDALKQTIEGNFFLRTGMAYDLFNLSKLAAFLRPEIEGRTKKPVTKSSILMQLSRLKRSEVFSSAKQEEYEVESITVYSNLLVLSYNRSDLENNEILKLHKKLSSKNDFFSLSEGARELTFILESKNEEWVKKTITRKTKLRRDNVSALAVSFDESYLKSPGMIYLLCRSLYIQNINIIEISSTATELILFVDMKELQLAFDTLFTRFMPQ